MTIFVFVFSLLGLLAIGMPIAFALLVCGLILMWWLGFGDTQSIMQNMWDGANNFPLLAVPFFMAAGELMNAGGMTRRIIRIAMTCIGHIRGGMGYVAIFAAIIMASLSGSAVADTAALAAILLPMMRQAGYDAPRAGGLIAAGGIIAPVIPPSIPMILYGVQGQVSITKLFMAGIVPGILMGLSLICVWRWYAKKLNIPIQPRAPYSECFKAIGEGFWALVLPVIVIGGLRFGYFTPTEAAIIAAAYSLFVGLVIYQEIRIRDLYRLFLASAKTTAVVMFLVTTATLSAWLITAADIPSQLADLLGPVMHSQILLIFTLMLLILAVGTMMDLTPTVLIMTPVLMPIIKSAHIDPVYFGVLFIINVSIGLITPPVGTVLNVICGTGKMSMEKVVGGVWPFLLAEVVILLLLVIFPSLVIVPMKWFA
jgi:tripartite ATP-independent transporter DctM subunit